MVPFKLTTFEIHPDDAVMDLLMRELDPQNTGDITFPMLRKHWPKDFRDATAVTFHGNARPADHARKGKNPGGFGWTGGVGTPPVQPRRSDGAGSAPPMASTVQSIEPGASRYTQFASVPCCCPNRTCPVQAHDLPSKAQSVHLPVVHVSTPT